MTVSNAPTLTAMLAEQARRIPDDTAYTFIYHRDGTEKTFAFTFKEVDDEARRIAADLKRLGLKPGQRILIFASQTHDNILSMFGGFYAGAIVTIIPPPVDEQKKVRFRSVLKSARPRFIVCNRFLAPILENAMYPSFLPKAVTKAAIRVVKGFSLFNIDEGRCKPEDYEPREISPDDTALLQYTSGSVSDPKGIMLSHRNIVSNMHDMLATAHYEIKGPTVGFAPFFHSIGLVWHGLFNVLVGYNSINISPLAFMEKPLRLFELASKNKAWMIAAPNSIYRHCAEVVRKEDLAGMDLSTIRAAGNGSEPIDYPTLEAFRERFKDTGFDIDSFTPGYGLSETTILITCQHKPAPVFTIRVDTAELEANRLVEVGNGAGGGSAAWSEVRGDFGPSADPRTPFPAGKADSGDVKGAPAGKASPAASAGEASPATGGPTRSFAFPAAASTPAEIRELVSCGEVMDKFTVRIVHPETGRPCASEEIGEIWVQGPSVAQGYWKNEAETEKAFRNTLEGADGYFLRTGDLGILHRDHLFVTGRIKELIIVNGKNYYPQDFELALSALPELGSPAAAAFSVSRQQGEDFVLCIEIPGTKAGGTDTGAAGKDTGPAGPELADRVSSLLLDRFGLAPDEIVFVAASTLPRTDNRKIKRLGVRELHDSGKLEVLWSSGGGAGSASNSRAAVGAGSGSAAGNAAAGTASPGKTAPDSSAIEARILDELAPAHLKGRRIGAADNLLTTGLDSLGVTRFLFAVEEAFGVEVPLSDLLAEPTVAALAGKIASATASAEAAAGSVPDASLNLPGEVFLPDDLAFAPSSSAPAAPEAVFLTGSTGFLGAYLISELCVRTSAHIYCHVRAADPAAGLKRLRGNLEYYRLWTSGMEDRLIPVPGDLTEPLLGMSSDDWHTVAGAADAVIHNGAQLNFLYPYRLLEPANVESTRQILRLCSVGKPKRLEYISSYSVFDTPDRFDNGVDETDPGASWEGFLLGYSQTKWVSERCIDLARSRGLDARIYRLGQITGDTVNGIWKAADFASQFLVSCVQLGMVPDIDVFVPLTPVDYIAKAVVEISLQEPGDVRNFHLVNSAVQSFAEFAGFLADAGYPVRRVSYGEWLEGFASQGEDNILYFFKDLIAARDRWGYTFMDRYSSRQARVLTDHTEKALAGTGVSCPEMIPEILLRYFESFRSQGVI